MGGVPLRRYHFSLSSLRSPRVSLSLREHGRSQIPLFFSPFFSSALLLLSFPLPSPSFLYLSFLLHPPSSLLSSFPSIPPSLQMCLCLDLTKTVGSVPDFTSAFLWVERSDLDCLPLITQQGLNSWKDFNLFPRCFPMYE